jgi:Fur family ferric uptake transcriptional regulator
MPRISQSYDENDNRDPIQDTVWMSGLKATKPRMAVVKALSDEDYPISITDLHKKIPEVSETSLYRTLEGLVEAGSVNRINTGASHSSYEISFGRKHHHHVICTKCGDMEDIESGKECPARKVEYMALANSDKFTSIKRHSLEFFGLCKKCA